MILAGDYEGAAKELAGSKGANEVLAYILNGQIDEAVANASCDTPRDAYIAAVAYARSGDKAKLKSALSKACVDAAYAEKYKKDVEFVDFR